MSVGLVDDPCVVCWLEGLAVSTRKNRLPVLAKFFQFVKLLPKEAVAWQKEHPADYRFVDLGYQWVRADVALAVGTKASRISLLRGFFLANRVPLPTDYKYNRRFHSSRIPVQTSLSVDEVRRILSSCNLDYRAAYLVMFQSGSGVGELLYINTIHADYVWNAVRKGKKIILLEMPGRKRNRNVQPYYTFIGSDAIEALRHLFHSRGWRKGTVLFHTERGGPVSATSLQWYFRSHAFKVGVIARQTPPCEQCSSETVYQKKNDTIIYVCVDCGHTNNVNRFSEDPKLRGGIRYRVRTHQLRHLFRTEWHRAQTMFGVDPEVGEFMMGHGVDRLKYDRIMEDRSYALDQYRRAQSMLNIVSEDPRKLERTEVQSELEALRERVVDQEKELSKVRRVLDDPDLLEALRSLKKGT